MPGTNFSGNNIINLLTRGQAVTPPSRVFVALHTSDPGNLGAGEVTVAAWPAYKRQDPAAGAGVETGFGAAAGKKTANLKQMLWPTHDGAAAVTVTHWSLWDAVTGGNCLWRGALTNPKTLNPSDEIVMHIGELKLEVD